ncbi:tRNA uridine-5-carboxymethylaminomethyl(34) synthesis GTPase MnmE [bacterium]|nr:tRNA uridine-5-carboxymethylaminomethyl(34) synthesis GTPase MnmE [bacterium]
MNETAQNFASVVSGEPIVAPSTPRGRSAIAVIRGSGNNIIEIFQNAVSPSKDIRKIESNYTTVVQIKIDNVVDKSMITIFRSPRSYTGEDMVELSVHGNPVLVDKIVKSAIEQGARLALPGEFTLRAVIHDKMSLIDAESVEATVEAQTERALSAARQATQFSKELADIKEKLWNILVEMSAVLEFPDDEIPDTNVINWLKNFADIDSYLHNFLEKAKKSKFLDIGLQIAIAGDVNVGKSTLFNWIVGAEKAIVTPHPGTTRDIIETTVEIDGVPIKLIDTAGLRRSEHPIEIEGIRRAKNVIENADIVIWVIDGSSALIDDKPPKNSIVTINKADLGISDTISKKFPDAAIISAKTGTGMDELVKKIEKRFAFIPADAIMVSIRTETLLREVCNEIEQATDALNKNFFDVAQIFAENADDSMAKILGIENRTDIYDEIFSKFCIGK